MCFNAPPGKQGEKRKKDIQRKIAIPIEFVRELAWHARCIVWVMEAKQKKNAVDASREAMALILEAIEAVEQEPGAHGSIDAALRLDTLYSLLRLEAKKLAEENK